jgi:hypothetical protein
MILYRHRLHSTTADATKLERQQAEATTRRLAKVSELRVWNRAMPAGTIASSRWFVLRRARPWPRGACGCIEPNGWKLPTG